MLGTAQSELGSIELGTTFQVPQILEPQLQPKLDPRSTKKKLAELDERDPDVVDPLIEELLRKKLEQPLVIRDPSLDPKSQDPQVVILKGEDRVIVKTIVVQAPASNPRRILLRRKRKRPKSRVMALSATPKIEMPLPIQTVQAIQAPIPTWPATVFWISLAIIGGILIGVLIANRSKPPKQSEVKLLRRARAIRQQS
jgi:hypothetical protein